MKAQFQIMMLTKFFEYQNIEKLDNVLDLTISHSHRFHLYTNLQVLFRPFSRFSKDSTTFVFELGGPLINRF